MESSTDHRNLRHDSLPVIDIRLISQPELLSLSRCSSLDAAAAEDDDGVLIPKIDRSVFNESAGSRKQTYSRLRLAPSAAAAARRSRIPSPEPPDPDSSRVIALLKRLFASDSDHDDLVPVPVDYSVSDGNYDGGDALPVLSLPIELIAVDSTPELKPAVIHGAVPSGSKKEVVLGLFPYSHGDSFGEPKQGRRGRNQNSVADVENKPRGLGNGVESEPVLSNCGSSAGAAASDVSVPVPVPFATVSGGSVTVNRKRGRPRKNTGSMALDIGGGFGSVDWGNLPVFSSGSVGDGTTPAPVLIPFSNTVSSDSVKRRAGRPKKNPKLNPEAESVSQWNMNKIPVVVPNPAGDDSGENVSSVLVPLSNEVSESQAMPVLPFNAASDGQTMHVPLPNADSESQAMTLQVSNSVSDGQALPVPPSNAVSDSEAVTVPLSNVVSDSQAMPMPFSNAVLDSQTMPVPLSNAVFDDQNLLVPSSSGISDSQTMLVSLSSSVSDSQAMAVPFSISVSDSQAIPVPLSSSISDYQATHVPLYNAVSDTQAMAMPLSKSVSDCQAMDIDPLPVFSSEAVCEASAGMPRGDGDGKRKRGRPRKGESRPISSAKVRVKKIAAAGNDAGVNVVQQEDLEKVNKNGEVVDLVVLGTLQDPFGEELRRRTEGLATEDELIGFLGGLEGNWGSWRRKKKVVQASEFGDVLPRGWKIQLSLKRKDNRAWLVCGRYISPSGQQFVSCKEVSSYLLASFQFPNDGQSESGLAGGNVQVANKPGSEIDLLFEDPKNPNEQVSCSSAPNSSVLTDQGEQPILTETKNPTEIRVENDLKCQQCTMSFDDKNDLAHHLLSSHVDLNRCNSPVSDGAILGEGKYECNFCHGMFDDRSHYENHVLLHTMACAESNRISQGQTSTLKKSDPVSSCISPTLSKMENPIGPNKEKPLSLEANDKDILRGNLKVDAPSETCAEKEREESSFGACRYDRSGDGFVSFSHQEKVTNGSKAGKDREFYENQTKTSYLTTEELGKLDEPWPEMGFQSNVFTQFDVDLDLNNSCSDVVDMIRSDDSRDCKASEFNTDTITRMEQDEISKRSSFLLSPYEYQYPYKDNMMSNRKAEEVKLDRHSSENNQEGQSENPQSYNFMINKKIQSVSPMEKSRNLEVKSLWNDKALHASGGMGDNAAKNAVINRISERFSHVISGSVQTFPVQNEMPCNSSNRMQELKTTRGSEFGLMYPSGTQQQIHEVDNSQNMFSGNLWEQQKLDGATNQFRNNELETGAVQQNSRPCGDNIPEFMWRTGHQNFQSSRLTDTSSAPPMQVPNNCFPNFNLFPNKDSYGGHSASERFDDIMGFDGLGGQGSAQQQQLPYNFLSAQGPSNSNDSRGLSQKQDYDPFFWFPKEDANMFPKTASSRHQTLTVCVWCRREFYHQDVGSQMKSGSAGTMCTTCQSKFLG